MWFEPVIIARRSRVFRYDATRFDNAVTYSVNYGGTLPRAPGDGGVLLGQVALRQHANGEWLAVPYRPHQAAGDQAWIGGFTSRHEAAIYLLGRRFERDNIGDNVQSGEIV